MKHRLVLLLAAVLLAFSSLAQPAISIGGNLSLGNKSFPKNGKLGVGASLDVYQHLKWGGGPRLYFGFDHFSHHISNPDSLLKSGYHGSNLAYLPVRLGYQQYLLPQKVFLYADLGFSRIYSKHRLRPPTKPVLSYGLGVGYDHRLNKNRFLKSSLNFNFNKYGPHYEWYDKYFTFRIAYGFQTAK